MDKETNFKIRRQIISNFFDGICNFRQSVIFAVRANNLSNP